MLERTIHVVAFCLVCLAAAQWAAASATAAPVSGVKSQPSLAEAVWTNYIAHTNGRSMRLWSQYTLPAGWPTSAAPVLVWNSDSLITAYSNYTGISQCWEGQGNRGQVPMTLLTPRHAYTRGHDVGAPSDGRPHILSHYVGKKVWFVTPANRVVEARIANWLTRRGYSSTNRDLEHYCDYSLVIFSKDLPRDITPLKVMSRTDYMKLYASDTNWPHVIFKTEQGGHVSTGVPPFICNTWKGGDSGSPDMLPIGHWLVFFEGRSTSGPSEQMQADMDTLTRSQGLNTNRYHLDWIGVGPRSEGRR